MGKRNKTEKFADLHNLHNVFQSESWPQVKLNNRKVEVDMKNNWNSFFKNDNPIVLELACGMGDYARNMAVIQPNRNYIGVDIKGNRIWSGATRAIENNLDNVAFIRTPIEVLEHFFGEGEVSEIWITFPDPQLKDRRAKKRLTHHRFLKLYRYLLNKDGFLNLKTDSTELYEFTLEIIEEDGNIETLENYNNLYASNYTNELLNIKTKYEKSHLKDGRLIKYLKMKLG